MTVKNKLKTEINIGSDREVKSSFGDVCRRSYESVNPCVQTVSKKNSFTICVERN